MLLTLIVAVPAELSAKHISEVEPFPGHPGAGRAPRMGPRTSLITPLRQINSDKTFNEDGPLQRGLLKRSGGQQEAEVDGERHGVATWCIMVHFASCQ